MIVRKHEVDDDECPICHYVTARHNPYDRSYLAAKHAWNHKRFVEGIKISRAANEAGVACEGISAVRVIDRTAAVKLVHQLALTFKRYFHYDFVQFPERKEREWDDDWWEHRTTAFVFAREGMAVGHVIVRKRERAWVFDRQKNRYTLEEAHEGAFWTIEQIMVCLNARRQGIAKQLIDAAAEHYQMEPHAFSWETPFSPEGFALAQATTQGKTLWIS